MFYTLIVRKCMVEICNSKTCSNTIRSNVTVRLSIEFEPIVEWLPRTKKNNKV